MAAGGSDGTKANFALALERSASPLATWTPMVGACWFRLEAGASGAKQNPLAPESAMPVWEIGRGGGLLACSVVSA